MTRLYGGVKAWEGETLGRAGGVGLSGKWRCTFGREEGRQGRGVGLRVEWGCISGLTLPLLLLPLTLGAAT